MKTQALIIGLLALSSNACVARSDHFGYTISNEDGQFTSEETQAIITSLDHWQASLNGALVIDTLQVGHCQKGEHQVCFHSVALASMPANEVGYTIGCGIDCADIYFPVDSNLSYEDTLKTFQHEIGHSLGLQHTQGQTTVMFFQLSNVSATITSADVDQYLFHHHLGENVGFTLDTEH